MILPFTVVIPANTNERKKIAEQDIPSGIITRVIIDIPSGWSYTAGIQILANDNIVCPSRTDSEEYITGDDTNLDLNIFKAVNQGKLEIYGVNYDSNDHSCVVFIELLTKEEIEVLRYLNGG